MISSPKRMNTKSFTKIMSGDQFRDQNKYVMLEEK